VVNPLTAIVTQPLASATVCSGVAQAYTVSATGSDLMYAWSNGLSNTTLMNTSVPGTYMVTATGSCGSVTSNAAQLILNPCSVTGVSASIAPYRFEICPNPNDGAFVIDFPSFENLESLSYTLTSIDGKVLANDKLAAGKNTIETNLTQGIYFVKVGSTAKKLIIE